MAWRFRGSPHYLDLAGERLGVSRVLTDQARHNMAIYRVALLAGQLSELLVRTAGFELSDSEVKRAANTLQQCRQEVEKLHCLAEAARRIVDEAHQAFGLEPPPCSFEIVCRPLPS